LLKKEVWDQAGTSDYKKLWECFGYEKTEEGQPNDYGRRRLLTPSLPNRFLAVVPAGKAADIGGEVEAEIRKTYENIARKVWAWSADKLPNAADWAATEGRFKLQRERFLDISWQALEWSQTPDDARKLAEILPQNDQHQPLSGVDVALEMSRQMPRNPEDHRDVRNFDCERFPEDTKRKGRDVSGWKDRSKLKADAKLDNPGAAWSALYQLVNWQLDAVRQTRAWKAWNAGGWRVGHDHNKDFLNGKEEAILAVGSAEEDAKKLNDDASIPNLFKPGELLGATTLIKRLWPTAWLQSKDIHASSDHQPLFERGDFSMPDTRQIAEGKPFAEDSGAAGSEETQKYFAVLALDGDEMGQWISGLHKEMPKLKDQLSPGALAYFQKHLPGLLDRRRPLSPSFHLQFSEMLANFSNYCVRRIVEAHDGRLIYSGGDDVLALLPAGTVLNCAVALREAFRGNPEALNELSGAWQRGTKQAFRLFDFDQPGFVRLHSEALCLEGEPKKLSALVPGPAADCSVGIAIAHFKSPLQDVVRAAQAAEKRAKKQLGRSAVAVTLMKRSGETIEWGCQWKSGGLELYQAVADGLEAEQLSNKFPHRLAELLGAYVTETTPLVKAAGTFLPVEHFNVDEVTRREFNHTLSRQRGAKFPKEKEAKESFLCNLAKALDGYLAGLAGKSTEEKLQSLISLCQTVAFAHRTAESNSSAPSASSVVSTSPAERQSA
jgi:CRISPR-associated protein Cmr2